ncbi:hypothetical protein BJX99DRAFT_240423 [Aspergillus californicus]
MAVDTPPTNKTSLSNVSRIFSVFERHFHGSIGLEQGPWTEYSLSPISRVQTPAGLRHNVQRRMTTPSVRANAMGARLRVFWKLRFQLVPVVHSLSRAIYTLAVPNSFKA